jgi:predicted enzyme related to lactoylglutathione lyase
MLRRFKGRTSMAVLGIGGLFFRARDPEGLSAWYKQHLGVGGGCAAPGGNDPPNEFVWATAAGPTVFQPFAADTDYFAADKSFMINLRVSDLDAMLETLRRAGVEIITKAEWDDIAVGRFARIHDPEGNAIELWEPPTATPGAAAA